ncbi:MAG TPA: hypothetical protein VHL31_10200 [Geminicoccus sp.]|jgi:hypothetical protein|uniref:hypothetical protein n=1 Tax=Geminicoccus sp. TaxID=2024832 RepID=UPI002E3010FC|nr:hypothetical protein [Geminicoccus sp.]HEX2526652.1 hypothetical protein [Geminicoccus sp.]
MLRPLTALLVLLSLAACNADPYDRPGTLQPAGVNDLNLQAMLVEPAHLHHGIGAVGSHGPTAADAVDRLLNGKRYPLPDTYIIVPDE